ncbi:MAG: allantoicase [Gammaproteobacteria bacterium]|nr:allantoicase [Gammaproteobacteria bacterium]
MKGSRPPFHQWVQLEQPRLGTRVTLATDEFFAPKERLIGPSDPVFVPDRYDANGKWMDGWESRRKRTPGHDHCIVRLGLPAIVRGVDIDTSHFTGNFPPFASIDGNSSEAEAPRSGWVEILPKTALSGDSHHYRPIDSGAVWTHLRLNIYPDGGIARLRIYGEVKAPTPVSDDLIDLFGVENGGRAISCSDEHFGSMHNLNLPGRSTDMGDGWETARRRGPGNDWVIIQLGHCGSVERAEVDTAHFKGNYPDRVSLEAALFGPAAAVDVDHSQWRTLLSETRLEMDRRHLFVSELRDLGPVSHVRMSIYPDGGVSRLRLFGRPQPLG